MDAPSAIAQLKAEHVEILRACQKGEVLAQSLLCGRHVLPEELSSMVQFFAEYVSDRYRLGDHDEARWWVRSLDQVTQAYSHGCGDSRRRWAETFAQFAAMLRRQIDEAARSVYPLQEASVRAASGATV